MKVVIVAGQGRKVGKTSVVTALIRRLRHLHWTAVKVSTHPSPAAHGVESHRGFILMEEHSASGTTDTGRFLAAGAQRAFWLRTTPELLREAIGSLLPALAQEGYVIIESSSAMELFEPRVGILVVGHSRRLHKPSTPRTIRRADALVKLLERGERLRQRRGALGIRTFARAGSHVPDLALVRFVQSALSRMSKSKLRVP